MHNYRTFETDLEQTTALGFAIGANAKPGDIVCLIGDLGAGKTTLTKGIGCALGLPEAQISSPTFALIAEHRGGRLPLYHLDVYRLSSGEDLTGTGFDDYLLAADGLTVIEWADRVSDALPADLLIVRITTPSDVSRRVIEISADGDGSEGLMAQLRDAHLPALRVPSSRREEPADSSGR